MAKKWYWWVFADGYRCCCMGFSKQEMRVETAKHGALVAKYED